MFDIDPIIPSFETKRVLLSQQVRVDQSHVSNGIFRWPFAIAPPTASVPSSSSSSSVAESSHGHQSTNGNSTGSNPRFQLIVTIYRQGRLTPNVGFVVSISCHESSLIVFQFQGETSNLLCSTSRSLSVAIVSPFNHN